MSNQDFSNLEQLKDKVASLDAKSELYYVFEANIEGTWYLICVDDSNSTESHLEIEKIIDYHNQRNVTSKWFENNLIEKYKNKLLTLSNKRKDDLNRK